MNLHYMITNLVFSGGGVKCISYIGLLHYFEQNNMIKDIKNIAGTSGGAIFGLMLLLGYSYVDLKNLIVSLDFENLRDVSCENLFKFNSHFGIDTGNKLENLIRLLIKKKKFDENITFIELYTIKKITFTITGTCLEKKCVEYFNHTFTPHMSVISAIRITYSIPIIYNCVRYNDFTYVDGGLLDNYPIKLFKNDIENTLGFYIYGENTSDKIVGVDNYMLSILLSMIRPHELDIVDTYKEYTIPIICNVGAIQFNIDSKEKEDMMMGAYQLITDYFNHKIILQVVIECIDDIISKL